MSKVLSTGSHEIEPEVRCSLLNRKVLADARALRALHTRLPIWKASTHCIHFQVERAPEEHPDWLKRYVLET
jgi:hypothetical protein